MNRLVTDGVGNLSSQAESLARELESRISGEVRFDAGSRGLYSTDGSNYRQVPIGVVIPRTVDELVDAVRIAHGYGVPVLGRGCRTSLAGQWRCLSMD